jgi:hypothetical protein
MILKKKSWFKMKIKTIVIAVGLLLLSPMYSISQADAPTPGSTEDPVITKSYFDQNNMTEDKVKQLISAAVANGTSSNAPSGSGSAGANPITVIQLKTGQTLYAGSGAEFIVRTGKTVAVSNDEDGIPDVTSGKDIAAGSAIGNNHLLVFPKDTRGVKAAPKNTEDIYIMVRGSYLLLNADGSKVTP